MLAAVRREVRDVAGFDAVWLYSIDRDRRHAHFRGEAGVSARTLRSLPTTLAVDLAPMLQEVARGEGPVVVDDAQIDARASSPLAAGAGNRTIVNVPLVGPDGPFAALGMGTFWDQGTRDVTAETIDHLVGISHCVALTFERLCGAATEPLVQLPVEIDEAANAVRRGSIVVSLGRRREVRLLLFTLAAAPGPVAKSTLVATAFQESYDAFRHDARLRVNLGRLRALVRPAGLGVVAGPSGYQLIAPSRVVMIAADRAK